MKILTSYAYGDIMTRDGLDARTKALVTLSMLATMGNTKAWVDNVTLGALRDDVARDDMVEAMLQLSVHGGYALQPSLHAQASEQRLRPEHSIGLNGRSQTRFECGISAGA